MSAKYPISEYDNKDFEVAVAMVKRFPLASFSTADNGEVQSTQFPLVWENEGVVSPESATLVGHIDKANPQVKGLSGKIATILFHGPNAYISPTHYVTPQFPTWNFVMTSFKAKVEIVTEKEQAKNYMQRVVKTMEEGKTDWQLDHDHPKFEYLIDYVETMKLHILEWHVRVKMSQEKTKGDIQGALRVFKDKNPQALDFIEYIANKENI